MILSRLAYIESQGQRERDGRGLAERVLERLSDADRAALTPPIARMSWYPFELNARLDRAIADAMGRGDAVFRELGAASAHDNLASEEQARFVREKNPHRLLQQASAIYGVYYDTGHRWYERAGDRKAVIRTMVSLSYSAEDCLTVVGWHEAAIAICGGTNVIVCEPLCRANGDPVCEYVCEWA